MVNVPWPDERVKEMLRLLATGLSTKETASALGISKNAVIGKLHRLGYRGGSLNGWEKRVNESRAKARRNRMRPRLGMFDMSVNSKRVPVMRKLRIDKPRVVAEAGVHKCTIMQLSGYSCRWPLWGENPNEDKFYCGAPVAKAPYCPEHTIINQRVPLRREPPRPFIMRKRPAKSPKSMDV